MVFSYEEKIIMKYLRIKYKCGATRIVNDRPEYKCNINGVKKLLKKIGRAGGISRKEGSGRPISERTEENIKLVKETILSQKKSARSSFYKNRNCT